MPTTRTSSLNDQEEENESRKRARGEEGGDDDPPSHVFVFDYDHTIVSENSDTHIPELLKAEHATGLFKHYDPKQGWTALMDAVVLACQEKDGRTLEDIEEKAREVPCFPELLQVLSLVSEKGPVHIVSDANSVFIKSFVDFHGVKVNSVHTNPAELDSAGRLRVKPYAQKPHGCDRCPKNMCKSTIVSEQIMPGFRPHRPKIVYFGDGSNDFCPVLNVLSEGDIVFARDDADEPRARGLVKRIDENPLRVKATVHRWAKGRHLLDLVKKHIL